MLFFLSTLIESEYGVYKKVGKNLKVAFGNWKQPLTDEKNWEKYINGTIYNGRNKFSNGILKRFSEQYEFCGHTSPDEYIVFLKETLAKLRPKTKLCLILGLEKDFHKDNELCLLHKHFNDAIREFSKKRVKNFVY